MLQASTVPLSQRFDLALIDLDGVTYRGPEPVAHAAASLASARADGMGLTFVTNNASREPEEVAAQLNALGIDAGPSEVATSAQAAAAVLATRLPPGARVLVVGGPGLLAAVRAAGFAVVTSADDVPDAVVQGFAPDVSWRELAEAAYAVALGAWHVVTNRDMTLPNERGLAPGNGALVAAVVAATGVQPLSAGKPEPTMFRLVAERRGSNRPLVVGDRLDTDLAGARAAGFPGLHVFTGVSSARDAVLAAVDERPSFIGADLRSLLVPHPVPERGPNGWWVCAGAAARVVSGALELDPVPLPDGGVSVGTVRSACAAVWSAADDDVRVDANRVPDLRVHEPGDDDVDR
jgi:HAD superfamily hydrolase (TIGR01450 family)